MEKTQFTHEVHEVDFCVVGGGIAGMFAAISAARHGATVALMHDRPVLGGNASSEIRMWVCGCGGRNLHETGLVEDILLDNCYYNPDRLFPIWDSILYGAVRYEKGILLFLNCSCNQVEMDGARIVAVTGWQTTTQKWITIRAKLFADCSGDSVLAPLAGADFRVGREARAEFGESLERDEADRRTMGMSCLIQAREMTTPQPYTPPPWAHVYASDSDLKPGIGDFAPGGNYWWLELGGMQDSIADTEEVRDELLRVFLRFRVPARKAAPPVEIKRSLEGVTLRAHQRAIPVGAVAVLQEGQPSREQLVEAGGLLRVPEHVVVAAGQDLAAGQRGDVFKVLPAVGQGLAPAVIARQHQRIPAADQPGAVSLKRLFMVFPHPAPELPRRLELGLEVQVQIPNGV